MRLILNVLFVALWSGLAFFALRYVSKRYFHERRRADVAAFGAVLAFAIGALLPIRDALGLERLPVAAVSADAPGTSIATASPAFVLRDVSSLCSASTRQLSDGGFGSNDTFVAQRNQAILNGSELSRSGRYRLQGWAGDVGHDKVAAAVCLVVDGKVFRGAKSLYGGARPDVVASFHAAALLSSAYTIAFVPTRLHSGRHRLQVAALSERGYLMALPGRWDVIIQ